MTTVYCRLQALNKFDGFLWTIASVKSRMRVISVLGCMYIRKYVVCKQIVCSYTFSLLLLFSLSIYIFNCLSLTFILSSCSFHFLCFSLTLCLSLSIFICLSPSPWPLSLSLSLFLGPTWALKGCPIRRRLDGDSDRGTLGAGLEAYLDAIRLGLTRVASQSSTLIQIKWKIPWNKSYRYTYINI